MIHKETWQIDYESEIKHAVKARANGNEGMARVCARRAAGIIIGEYLTRRGLTNLNNSAFDRLSMFLYSPNVDEHDKEITNHFLIKVNFDRNLPDNVDLIHDVELLVEHLILNK